MQNGILLALLALAPSVYGQRTLIVDATGNGQYRTINAAIQAAGARDQIHVRRGTYAEAIALDNKPVTILGIGNSPAEVILQPPSGTIGIDIRNHPGSATSRFSRFTIGPMPGQVAVTTTNTAGTILLDSLTATQEFAFRQHAGTLALTASVLINPGSVLHASYVRDLLCHDCHLWTTASGGYLVTTPSTFVQFSRAHFSRCRMVGANGGQYLILTYPGGPALHAFECDIRVSGVAADFIRGGNGKMSGMRTSPGGPGILLGGRSTLSISGVTVTGGRGIFFGRNHQAEPIRADRTSTVVKVSPPMPALLVRPTFPPNDMFARGGSTNVEILTTPNAQSLTWIALEVRPFQSPWGTMVIDLGRPVFPIPATHDSQGRATFTLDLRLLPSTYVGWSYAVQTLALTTGNQLRLSGPRIGTIGH